MNMSHHWVKLLQNMTWSMIRTFQNNCKRQYAVIYAQWVGGTTVSMYFPFVHDDD